MRKLHCLKHKLFLGSLIFLAGMRAWATPTISASTEQTVLKTCINLPLDKIWSCIENILPANPMKLNKKEPVKIWLYPDLPVRLALLKGTSIEEFSTWSTDKIQVTEYVFLLLEKAPGKWSVAKKMIEFERKALIPELHFSGYRNTNYEDEFLPEGSSQVEVRSNGKISILTIFAKLVDEWEELPTAEKKVLRGKVETYYEWACTVPRPGQFALQCTKLLIRGCHGTYTESTSDKEVKSTEKPFAEEDYKTIMEVLDERHVRYVASVGNQSLTQKLPSGKFTKKCSLPTIGEFAF